MSFPTTGLLDDFNRPFQDPIAAPGWAGQPISSGGGQLALISNALTQPAGGFRDSYMTAVYGPDMENHVEVVSWPGSAILELWIRVTNPAVGVNGYFLDVRAGAWTIWRSTLSVQTQLATGASAPAVAAGDSIGVEIIGDTIRGYHKPAAGSWTLIVTATDATHSTAGNIGVGMSGGPVVDNLGGGTIGVVPPPDTEPPTAPGTLTATAGTTNVLLSWGAAGDNEAVTHYNVHRSGTPGFTPAPANRIAQPLGLSYNDTGRPAGTYYYRVTAEDAAGNIGPASNEASATVVGVAPAGPGLWDQMEAIASALEPLTTEIAGLQIVTGLNPNPTPPSIDIYPSDPFQNGVAFGVGNNEAFFTVRARVSTADHEAGNRLLIRMLDPNDPASVQSAIEDADVAVVTEEGVSGFREYLEDSQQNGRLLGSEWRVRRYV